MLEKLLCCLFASQIGEMPEPALPPTQTAIVVQPLSPKLKRTLGSGSGNLSLPPAVASTEKYYQGSPAVLHHDN
jgi:hypothetical protein